jgi:hypothetical protein
MMIKKMRGGSLSQKNIMVLFLNSNFRWGLQKYFGMKEQTEGDFRSVRG